MSSDSASKTQIGGDHYKSFVIEPIEFCYKNKIPTIESSVIKYVVRHKRKNGREDLEKAIHLLQLLIEYEYHD